MLIEIYAVQITFSQMMDQLINYLLIIMVYEYRHRE